MAQIEVIVKGQIDPQWGEWFANLEVELQGDGTTRLHGDIPDQSALYGILAKLRDLGLELISVESTAYGERSS
jgi:hypothetical protein